MEWTVAAGKVAKRPRAAFCTHAASFVSSLFSDTVLRSFGHVAVSSHFVDMFLPVVQCRFCFTFTFCPPAVCLLSVFLNCLHLANEDGQFGLNIQQVAAVLAAKRRIAAAVYRIRLRYSLMFPTIL